MAPNTAYSVMGVINNVNIVSMSRSRHNSKYNEIMDNNTVDQLRNILRGYGYKKWYCLKKNGLVSLLVVDYCTRKIVSFFKRVMSYKHDVKIKKSICENDSCPICMSSIDSFNRNDLFVHDNVVFCRDDIIRFIKSEYNFTNPITRSQIHFHRVKDLRDIGLVDSYLQKDSLRRNAVDSSMHFFYLENDIFYELMDLLRATESNRVDIFRETYIQFDAMIKQMYELDRCRTLCVLKGLFDMTKDMYYYDRMWCDNLISRYITNITTMCDV